MKISFAPMEGITGYIFRNAFMKHYSGVDSFYTPFISPSTSKSFKGKDKRDVNPANNDVTRIIPQVMTNNSQEFLDTAIFLYEFGYKEINLNLGCPSGTVVAKGKGAGFLKDPSALDRFFSEVFMELDNYPDLAFSVKTRLGLESADEFKELLKVYDSYDFSKLIIHPRVRNDYYNGTPNMDAFEYALNNSKHKIVYNGDITTAKQFKNICEKYPELDEIMIGRGLLTNPELAEQIVNNEAVPINKRRLLDFHKDLVAGYRLEMNGERDVIFRMKELWTYLSRSFPEVPDLHRKLSRITDMDDYMLAVKHLLT